MYSWAEALSKPRFRQNVHAIVDNNVWGLFSCRANASRVDCAQKTRSADRTPRGRLFLQWLRLRDFFFKNRKTSPVITPACAFVCTYPHETMCMYIRFVEFFSYANLHDSIMMIAYLLYATNTHVSVRFCLRLSSLDVYNFAGYSFKQNITLHCERKLR